MNRIILIILYSLFPVFSSAQQTSIPAKHLNLEKGIAIDGYDAVAYLTQNKASKGSEKISSINNGATYYFTSEINKQLFLKNPAKYEPQYGGWCAYAMGSDGKKVKIDPETFKIIDGRLYLFYNAFFNNTLKSWNSNETKLKQKADVNWSEIIKK